MIGRQILLATALFSGSTAFATGQAITSRIAKITLYDSGDVVYVYPVGGLPNPPACSTNGPYVSFSMARKRAREYLSALIVAQASGATVYLRTLGDCVDQGVSDTLNYFEVHSN